MSKKRNAHEQKIHDFAVKIRKMTDEQIYTHFCNAYNDGYTAGNETVKELYVSVKTAR